MKFTTFTLRVALTWIAGVTSIAMAFGQDGYTPRFNSGQNLQPVYEGWSRNPDGSYFMWFGYLNRNFEERLNIPVGPNNGFGPVNEDMGQPEYFLPRRKEFVFKVKLPADWPKDKDLVWTVTAHGSTLKAFGSLWPVWEIDEHTISANRMRRTAVDFDEPGNEPPSIISASPDQTIAVGTPVTLTLNVTDDGNPKPRVDRGGSVAGITKKAAPSPAETDCPSNGTCLKVTWVQWRGPGTAKFSTTSSPVKQGQASTSVTFDKPGTYTVRGYAEDGSSFTEKDLKITVTGSQNNH